MLRTSTTVALAAAALAPFLPGCSTGTASGLNSRLAIDGDLGEWRGGAYTVSTADAVYFRFSPGEEASIQANDETTRLVFDLDDSAATGKALQGPPEIGTLGVDLEILLSPPVGELAPAEAQRLRSNAARYNDPPPEMASGMTVLRHDAPGAVTHLGHADIGFIASPTHASDWFEAKLDRHAPALAGTGLATAGDARAVVLMTDPEGDVLRYSDPLTFVLPEPGAGHRLSTAGIPAQPSNTIRVLSINVLRGKPVTEPAPFARLITAVQPDVILFQEADDLDAERLEAWLSGYVGVLPAKHEWAQGVQSLAGGVGAWDAASMPDTGVAIATPHVIAGVYDDPVEFSDNGTPRTVRAITALVSTPLGDVLACSTHLKCCGTAGSSEDLRRLGEAGALNDRFAAIADAITAGEGRQIDARVIGGDLNLVGTRGPLDILAGGLSGSGRDLEPADTMILGQDVLYTWRNDRSSFAPGRLDWVLTGDARVVQSFAFDTRRMDPATLEAAGLEPGDSDASDHLPVVVDLRP